MSALEVLWSARARRRFATGGGARRTLTTTALRRKAEMRAAIDCRRRFATAIHCPFICGEVIRYWCRGPLDYARRHENPFTDHPERNCAPGRKYAGDDEQRLQEHLASMVLTDVQHTAPSAIMNVGVLQI